MYCLLASELFAGKRCNEVLQDDEHTVRGAEEGTRRRLPNYRNFRAEAVEVEDPFVNVPDTRGEMVIVCDYTD